MNRIIKNFIQKKISIKILSTLLSHIKSEKRYKELIFPNKHA